MFAIICKITSKIIPSYWMDEIQHTPWHGVLRTWRCNVVIKLPLCNMEMQSISLHADRWRIILYYETLLDIIISDLRKNRAIMIFWFISCIKFSFITFSFCVLADSLNENCVVYFADLDFIPTKWGRINEHSLWIIIFWFITTNFPARSYSPSVLAFEQLLLFTRTSDNFKFCSWLGANYQQC